MAESDTGDMIASGGAARNAICAKQPSAFLAIGGHVSVLRRENRWQRQQKQMRNLFHAYRVALKIGP
jgi:hypothetical protein